jgi:hypothetical protein
MSAYESVKYPDRRRFSQRTNTLKTKAHEVGKIFDADVYLIVSASHETVVYNSVQDRQWPPADNLLVSAAGILF